METKMIRFVLIAVSTMLLLAFSAIAYADYGVSGSGSATAPSLDEASSIATNEAYSEMRSACRGTLTGVEYSQDSEHNPDNTYTVNVQGGGDCMTSQENK